MVGEKARTLERERAKRTRGALGSGPGAGDERKMAIHLEAGDLRNLERAQFQFLGDRPTRDEANAESDFHRRLDCFGGIEIHHVLERLQLEARILESHFDDAARSGTLFAHQKIGGQRVARETSDRLRMPGA